MLSLAFTALVLDADVDRSELVQSLLDPEHGRRWGQDPPGATDRTGVLRQQTSLHRLLFAGFDICNA